ncbi:MAG: PilZ domain-containing protein [Pseudomonadota bacterium]
MVASQPVAATQPQSIRRIKNRRRFKRVDLEINGRFLSEDGDDCTLSTVNVSCAGALVRAETLPAIGADIVCYFDDLGRVQSKVVRHGPSVFAVAFEVSRHKRDKLADRLTWLFNADTLGLSDDRAAPRYVTDGPAMVVRADGRTLQCRVIDISMTGASFEAEGPAPYVGEVVQAGNLSGEVIRRERSKFAIRFQRVADA